MHNTYFIPEKVSSTVHDRFVQHIIEKLPANERQDSVFFVYKYKKEEEEISIYAQYKVDQVTRHPNGKYEPSGIPLGIKASYNNKKLHFANRTLSDLTALLKLLDFTFLVVAFFRRIQCTYKFNYIDFVFKYDINSRDQRCITIEAPSIGPIANIDQTFLSLETLLALDSKNKIGDYEFT